MAVYRCRWQVEPLFKELKSHTNWIGFATGQKAIAEGLIWASLLALIVQRSLAKRFFIFSFLSQGSQKC
ncbi:transposase IS4 family protein [Photorhabdus temperata subsp. temperata M1021]|nr:transposase IS4 family protein [Photorhabdus temperata subsp. temperata M1021]